MGGLRAVKHVHHEPYFFRQLAFGNDESVQTVTGLVQREKVAKPRMSFVRPDNRPT
jgi:hypothetical protein